MPDRKKGGNGSRPRVETGKGGGVGAPDQSAPGRKVAQKFGMTSAEFVERVTELQKLNEEIRDSRRAALNALEDAVLSREALRESEERFRVMFEQANVGIMQIDFDGKVLRVNPGFCKLVGYTEGECRNLTVRDVTHPDDYKAEVIEMRRLLAGETNGFSMEKRLIRKDTQTIRGHMTVTLVRHATGKPFYALAIVEDISARKATQEALLRAREELEDRVRSRTLELAKVNESLREEISQRIQIERARVRLIRQIVRAQEDERRRVARDIHDHLGQQMTALRLNLETLNEGCGKDEELRRKLEQTKTIAERLDADVDFLAWELRPAALDDIGLAETLSSYVLEWSKYSGVEAQFHTIGMDKGRLAPETETTLYRITQEALNNTMKYARARRVDVLLERRDEQVVLIVEDDGVGFDPKKAAGGNGEKGMGLVGMRERAALVGGILEVESRAKEGTTIFARVPVKFLEEEA